MVQGAGFLDSSRTTPALGTEPIRIRVVVLGVVRCKSRRAAGDEEHTWIGGN